jgi:anoctamin-1
MELFIQLAIIMIGKQAFNSILEMGLPWAMKKYRKFMYGRATKTTNEADPELRLYNQWTKDYKLNPWNSMGLFHEYLEMVLQFG